MNSTLHGLKLAFLLLILLLILSWCHLLVWHVLVGALWFTTTATLGSLFSIFATVVALPNEHPVRHTKFHWCIARPILLL